MDLFIYYERIGGKDLSISELALRSSLLLESKKGSHHQVSRTSGSVSSSNPFELSFSIFRFSFQIYLFRSAKVSLQQSRVGINFCLIMRTDCRECKVYTYTYTYIYIEKERARVPVGNIKGIFERTVSFDALFKERESLPIFIAKNN